MNQAIANLAASMVRHDHPKWEFTATGELVMNGHSAQVGVINSSEETRTAIQVNRWLFYLEPNESEWIVKGSLGRSELTFPYSIKDSSDLNRSLIRTVGVMFWPIVHSSGRVKSILDCPDRTRVSLRYRVNPYKTES